MTLTVQIPQKFRDRNVYSESDFQRIIKKERFRSDRSNYGFSLILFNISSFFDTEENIFAFLENIIMRIRISDEIGWFNSRNIGLLLPDTKLNGAHNLAEQIVSASNCDALDLPYNIFVYPNFWWTPENDIAKRSFFE